MKLPGSSTLPIRYGPHVFFLINKVVLYRIKMKIVLYSFDANHHSVKRESKLNNVLEKARSYLSNSFSHQPSPELYVDIFENVGRYGDGAGSNHITNSKDLNRLSGLEKITSDFVDSDEETDFMSKKKHKSNKVIL